MADYQGWAQNVVHDTPFTFPGGVMNFAAVATWGGGSAKIQQLMPNGTTWADVASGSLSADGALNITMPPGIYKMVVTTATGVTARATRVPGE